jgi:signal transduction histidine kinase
MTPALRGHEVHVSIRDESDIVMARKAVRDLATKLGLPVDAVEALATAVSEVARNILVHATSGEVLAGVALEGSRAGVAVVARDQGPGIADIERALEDGYSTAGSLGFGLAGARRLVDEFEIASAIGKGTAVTMTKWAPIGKPLSLLSPPGRRAEKPAFVDQLEEGGQPPPMATWTSPANGLGVRESLRRPLRALILEDSEMDAEILVRELRSGGRDVAHRRVQTAREMRTALAEEPWDLVLSDFSMPGFNALVGIGVLKETGLDIPFIIVSGTIGEETAVEALKSGAHDFFVKGRLGRLLAAIEHELLEARARGVLREAARARDEFLSIASHELRTPLTTLVLQLKSALDLVRSRRHTEVPPEKLETKLEIASRQVDRLMALIDALLDFSKISAGRLTISPASVDLGELIEGVVAHLDVIIKHSRSEVILKTEKRVIGFWDPVWLEIVVSNLLSNAAKFGEGKSIEVTVDHEGDLARLVVVDHGIGIASEDQGRVFQRFERAVSSRNFGGFGVGLWVAKQVVEAHRGSIQVSSGTGGGSAFTVLLPQTPPP